MSRRTGQIIERDNSFTVRVYLGTDATGKRQYHNHRIRGPKKDAQKWLTAALRRLDMGEPIEESGELVEQFLDRWLEGAVKQRASERTFDHYQVITANYLKPAFNHRRLSDINATDITSLLQRLREQGLSSRTQRYVFGLLKNAMKQAVRWQLIRINPCDAVDTPKAERKEQQAFSAAQVKLFLDAAQDQRHEIAFVMAFTLGARPGEYLGLKWSDIDWQAKTITIQRSLVWRASGDWYVKDTKTKTSRRSIPLSAELHKRLLAHKRQQQEARLKAGNVWKHKDFIITDDFGDPASLNAIRTSFQRILKLAGLPESFPLYGTRHSVATVMMANGVNPKVVSERLGHSDVSMTLRVYSHVQPTMQQEASEQIENAIFG